MKSGIRFTSSQRGDSAWLAGELKQAEPFRRVADENAVEKTLRSPWLGIGVAGGVIFLAAVLRVLDPTVLPAWAPKDPAEVLGLAWQVQTSIAAIAFAGLALIIQLAGAPPIAISSSREVLFRRTFFRGLLLYAGATNVALGVVTTWASSAAGVLICFLFCFLSTVVFIGFSYLRVAAYFLDAEEARIAALAVLRDKIGGGLHELRLVSAANTRLAELFPAGSPISRYASTPEGAHETQLMVLPDDHYVKDLDPAGLKLAAVEILRLIRAPGFTASMPAEQGMVPQNAASRAVEPFLRIEFGLGQRVPAGDQLFTLVTAGPVGAGLAKKASARLRRCVMVRPAGGTGGRNPEDTIRNELITLKDSTLVAVGTGASGALKNGLDAHEELFSALMRAAQNRKSDAGLRSQSYGPHWRWLHDNIREITDVAIRTMGSRGLTLAVDHTYSLCRTAFKAHDLSALREFLGLYPTHLRCAISMRDPLPVDYVAVSMQNLTSLYFRAVSIDDPDLQDVLLDFAAETFAESFKACIDARDADAFERLLPYFEIRSTFFTSNAERRAAAGGKAVVLLALLAWTFFSAARGVSDAARLAPIAATLADSVPSHLIWQAYRNAVDAGRPSYWQHWEIAVKEPLTFHIMTFDGYLAAAALVMGGQRAMTLPDPSAESLEQANLLLGAVDQAEEALRHFPDLDQTGLGAVKERLARFLQAAKEMQRDELRRRPLESDKVRDFVEAVPRALRESQYRLTELLPHVTGAPMLEEPRQYLINSLVPRQYFVTVPRHVFEPAELAIDVANGMIAGENLFVVESLLAGRQPETVSEDHVQEIVRGFTQSEPFVIVLNSWQAAMTLGVADPLTGPVGGSPTYFGLSLDTDDLKMGRVPPTCIVCDLDLLPAVVRDPFRLDAEGEWHSRDDVGIAMTVRDYADDPNDPVAQLVAGVSLGWSDDLSPEAVKVYRLLETL